MTTFDQSADRATVEADMLDTCIITRDPERETDDVLNPTTLELEPASGDRIIVYADPDDQTKGAPCRFSAYNVANADRTEGARRETRQQWKARIPVAADPPLYGDRFVLTSSSSEGNESLVGRYFRVERIGAHTQAVSRWFVLEDEKGATAE